MCDERFASATARWCSYIHPNPVTSSANPGRINTRPEISHLQNTRVSSAHSFFFLFLLHQKVTEPATTTAFTLPQRACCQALSGAVALEMNAIARIRKLPVPLGEFKYSR